MTSLRALKGTRGFTCESHAAGEGGVLEHLAVVVNNHLEGEAQILGRTRTSLAFLSTQGVWEGELVLRT